MLEIANIHTYGVLGRINIIDIGARSEMILMIIMASGIRELMGPEFSQHLSYS